MRAPDFWQADGPLARLLGPLGKVVGMAGAVRRRLASPTTLPIPIICVGNLTVGGTGKTPTAIALARLLKVRGADPHFLTRGYGGRKRGPLQVDIATQSADDVGDEALLLAAIAPCWVSRDRVVGAKMALDAGADVIILDDGHQNSQLAYDLAMVVIDGEVGFGNHRIIPAGPLRETVANGLSRADALLVIGDSPNREALSADLPIFGATFVPAAHSPNFHGEKVVAFAGIGRPEKFFKTLQELGADLVQVHAFPDHHRYKPSEIGAILEEARQVDAVCVTTEKDHVRLPLPLGNYVKKLPIELKFDATDALDRLLADALHTRLGI